MNEKIKEVIKKLKEKYGIKMNNYYPSKVEVLRELERKIEELENAQT